MENPIKLIYKFNKEAGLLEKGYDDFLETSFQIEEALENFSGLPDLADRLHTESITPKALSREIVKTAMGKDNKLPTNVQRLDKAIDAVVFAIGSIAKLGLKPQEIAQAINIVMHHNKVKLSMPKDEFGKLTKPDNFVGPEEELQKLLERSAKHKT